MNEKGNFVELKNASRIWAVGAIHSNLDSFSSIKKHPHLKELLLVKQSRLSVMPIDTKSWKIINKISSINK